MSRGSRRTSSTRQSRWALAFLVAVGAALVGGPQDAAAADPCPSQAHYEWMGASTSAAVSIPSLTHPDGIAAFDGTIVRPTDEAAYPGPRPVVLLQHGLGGNQCAQWWSAQDLAGHGFIALVWTAPKGASNVTAFFNAVDAMRSALAFVRTPANPYAATSDTTRIALAGHSLGSIVASFVQQDADPGVRAIVALDTLRRWVNGDPGGAVFECTAAQGLEITPRVPALGFAKDEPCDAKPDYAPADLKLPGYLQWESAGVPAIELVMAGYNHLDFATPGSEQKHRDLAHFIEAWLDRWLLDERSAEDAFFARTVLGRPIEDLLSTRFLSGAYLPPRVDSADFRAFLADAVAPQTKRKRGPRRRVRREQARQGIRFRWTADDQEASSECRLDSHRWRPCDSPERVRNATARGVHRFRVRATDTRGNVEPKPAIWKFRVVR